MAETSKLKARWIRDGLYDQFIQGHGIDIGVGRIDTYDGADPIALENCVHHDKDTCDAHTMDVFEDNTFDYVYASHIIEHLEDPFTAVANWIRICKPGGYVIIYAPHRDLYECQKSLPSRWNADHKVFLLPNKTELPFTLSLEAIIKSVLGKNVLCWCRAADEGYVREGDAHPGGEYSIEAVILKG